MSTHLELPDKWTPSLLKQGETGMGYQTASVTLRDGRVIEDVLIIGGTVVEVRGCDTIPFSVEDISVLFTRSHRLLSNTRERALSRDGASEP